MTHRPITSCRCYPPVYRHMYRHVHGHVYRRMCRRLCRRACAHGGRRIGHHRKWRLLRASLHVYRHVHKHVCCLQSCRLVFSIPDGTSADYIVRILSTAFHTKEALRLVARHEHVPCLRRSKLLFVYMRRTRIHTLVPACARTCAHTHAAHTCGTYIPKNVARVHKFTRAC